uniref:Uncharacterized protein n=1 Tax=Opuntia streptacantha TaxID=393608 RepID=A0A7C9FEB8_OPUST
MAKPHPHPHSHSHSSSTSTTAFLGLSSHKKKTWGLMILALFSVSTLIVILMRATISDSCADSIRDYRKDSTQREIPGFSSSSRASSSPLYFMKSKLVLLVSHELSLSDSSLQAKDFDVGH